MQKWEYLVLSVDYTIEEKGTKKWIWYIGKKRQGTVSEDGCPTQAQPAGQLRLFPLLRMVKWQK